MWAGNYTQVDVFEGTGHWDCLKVDVTLELGVFCGKEWNMEFI